MNFKDSRMRFYIPDRSQLQQRLDIMSDTKPIMTQEKLTEEMKVGAKRLKSLMENITKLSNDIAFRAALNAFFKLDYFEPSYPILCS